jgi:hypothetical protein
LRCSYALRATTPCSGKVAVPGKSGAHHGAAQRPGGIGGSAGLDPVPWPRLCLRYENPGGGQVEKIQVAEADGAGFATRSGRSFSQGAGRARPAVLAVDDLTRVMNAKRSGLRAIREHMPQLGQLGVAVLLHEPGDVVAPAPAARLALRSRARGRGGPRGWGRDLSCLGWR